MKTTTALLILLALASCADAARPSACSGGSCGVGAATPAYAALPTAYAPAASTLAYRPSVNRVAAPAAYAAPAVAPISVQTRRFPFGRRR